MDIPNRDRAPEPYRFEEFPERESAARYLHECHIKMVECLFSDRHAKEPVVHEKGATTFVSLRHNRRHFSALSVHTYWSDDGRLMHQVVPKHQYL